MVALIGFNGLSFGVFQANLVLHYSSRQPAIAVQTTWPKAVPSQLFGTFHSYTVALTRIIN